MPDPSPCSLDFGLKHAYRWCLWEQARSAISLKHTNEDVHSLITPLVLSWVRPWRKLVPVTNRYLASLLILISPIIGGYLNQGLGWRSNFWFLAIFAFCIWVAILLILPETRQRNQEEKEKKRKMVNPLMALQLLKHFNIALTVTFIAILYVCVPWNRKEEERLISLPGFLRFI